MSFDLPEWLIDIGLPQYLELFLSQGFDGPGLASLTDADLRELGIAAMGHRKTILREAAKLALPQALVSEPDQVSAVAPLLPVQSMPRGRVFLSYGHDPACVEIVQRIRLDLQAAGWEPWVDDKGIRFGDDWRREITKGIQESQHVLAFLSQHSTRKPGVCRQEVAIALGPRKGHVYTVLVEPLERVSPPLIVSHMQWLDMQQWQELKLNDPAAYEALYRKSLAEILRVLERNEPFAGDIELLQRWLDPLDGTTDMLAAEEGFTGRRWLLDGLVEQPAWKTDDGSEVLSTQDGSVNPAFAGEADQVSPTAPVGEIERWRTSGSPNRVFWISAGPGWGKSAVAARLAHAARGRVMAVHYCRYNKPGTRDARQVVRTLAFQMATQLGDYRELLVRQAKQGSALAELNALELFDKLLANPLAHELGGGRGAHDRHLIVLDALDETLEDDQSELLNLVAGEFGKLPPWLGLVVTSRPEAPVLRQLGAFGVQHQREDDPRNLQDLRAYVDFWLQGVALEPAQREQALSAVVQASEGMFLYVRQLREAVDSGAVPPAQLTDPGSLPKGLAGLYERWFQARFKDDKGQIAYDAWQRPLLELMLAAREPLPVALAHAVLDWGPYGEANALEPLGTLCSQQGGTVSLFHKSLADWLSKREDSGRRFHVSTAQGHQRLATGLWSAYTQWRDAGAYLNGSTGWEALGDAGETYALRHLCAQLMAAGRAPDARVALADFALAMRRCQSGAIESLLEDYRPLRQAARSEPLQAWADGIVANAHLMRRGLPGWPAERILLQVATEHADDSPLTQAAEDWLERGECNWVWVKQVNRRKKYLPSPLLTTLEGHTAEVIGALYLSDGRILSWAGRWTDDPSSESSHALHLWDVTNGALLSVMKGHTDRIYGAHLLPDDRFLSWSSDQTLRIWDLQTCRPLAVLEGHNLGVNGACSLPDGRLLSWSNDKTLRIWDGQSGAPLAVLKGHTTDVSGALPLPDGRFISWSSDKTLRIWNGQSGEALSVMSGHTFSVRGIYPLQDGRLISWSTDNTLRIWDALNGEPLATLEGHNRGANGACSLPDGRLLSWAGDHNLRLWDGLSGAPLAEFKGHYGEVNGAVVLPDGRALSWSTDSTLRIWDLQSSQPLAVLVGHNREVNGACCLPDGRLLSWSSDHTLRIWDGQSGAPLAVLNGHNGVVNGAVLLPENRILSWSKDKTLRIWDEHSVEPLSLTGSHTDVIRGAKKLPDNTILSWSDDGTMRLWDAPSGEQLAVLEGHTGPVNGVSLLPGDWVLSWSDDATLRLWNWRSRKLIAVLQGHKDAVIGVYQLADGQLLSWSKDCSLRLWNGQSGESIAVLQGHSGKILGIKMLANGRVVTWSWDTFCLWDVNRGTLISILEGHTRTIKGVLSMPDGRLLSWAEDHTIRIWDGLSGSPLQMIEGSLGSVEISVNGRVLSWYLDEIRIFEGEINLSPSKAARSFRTRIEGATFLPNGQVLSWWHDGTLRLWDGEAGSAMEVVERHRGGILGFCSLPDIGLLMWSDETFRHCDNKWDGTDTVVNQPWVWNIDLPVAWSHHLVDEIGGAKGFDDIWTQGNNASVVIADKNGQWRTIWHGKTSIQHCQVGNIIVCSSSQQMFFLRLEHHQKQPVESFSEAHVQ